MATAPEHTAVDLRCPSNPSRLFARLVLDDRGVVRGIEVSCRDCRKQGEPHMHLYTPDGLALATSSTSHPRLTTS